MDLKPFSECENPGLNLLLKGMNRLYNMPSRETLKTNVIQPMYKETRDVIKKLLVPATNIALTCDIWTTLQGSTRCYITVTCHLIDENLKLHEFVLTTEEMGVSHTAENVLERLQEIMLDWELGEKNITFVTDNAGEMKKATSTLGKFPWLSCGGHVLNLVASSAFEKVEAVNTLITKCKSIVRFIKRSTTASNALCDHR